MYNMCMMLKSTYIQNRLNRTIGSTQLNAIESGAKNSPVVVSMEGVVGGTLIGVGKVEGWAPVR